MGDQLLDHLGRARRQLLAPQPLGQPVGRHHPPGLEREHRQHRALLARAERERPPADAHLDRPEQDELHATQCLAASLNGARRSGAPVTGSRLPTGAMIPPAGGESAYRSVCAGRHGRGLASADASRPASVLSRLRQGALALGPPTAPQAHRRRVQEPSSVGGPDSRSSPTTRAPPTPWSTSRSRLRCRRFSPPVFALGPRDRLLLGACAFQGTDWARPMPMRVRAGNPPVRARGRNADAHPAGSQQRRSPPS